MIGRKKIVSFGQEALDILKITDNISSLQTSQKEMADSIAALGELIRDVRAELREVKNEAKLDAVVRAQEVVSSVQNGFNQRMEDMAVKVALLEQTRSMAYADRQRPELPNRDSSEKDEGS